MSIAIVEMSSMDLTKKELYLMTQAPDIKVIKDVEDGTIIPVKAWCIFEDTKEQTGEVVSLLSILTPDNIAYSCQSATFKRSFNDILTIMEDEAFSIKKFSGTTKAGRPFVNCSLVVE